MNPILDAINKGYSNDQVLQFISKVIPKLVPQINKAVSQGYGIKQVLGFLAKSSPQDTKGMSETQVHRRNRDFDSQLAQKGLMAAATAPLIANSARSALSRALPQSLAPIAQSPSAALSHDSSPLPAGDMNTSPQAQTLEQTPISNNPIVSKKTPANPVAASIPEPANIQQAKEKALQPQDVLNNFGIKDQVDALLNNNDPEIAAKTAWSLMTPIQKKTYENAFKKGEVKPINEVVSEYAKSKLSPTEQHAIPQLQEAKQLQEPLKEQERPKIEKTAL